MQYNRVIHQPAELHIAMLIPSVTLWTMRPVDLKILSSLPRQGNRGLVFQESFGAEVFKNMLPITRIHLPIGKSSDQKIYHVLN